ncbi:MAG TPA: thiamine phosphate synthase [Pyrinomonadaceae bacterium]|nr:thiamine phosphate synthase [Pyrinomonadaceae bacterium]
MAVKRDFLSYLGPDRIYPITDRLASGLSHAQQVAEFGRRGFRLVQLRDKHLSAREFFREAEEARTVARAYGMRLIINDRVDVALAVRADGVHLGQDDLSPEAARHLLGDEAIIGFSTHHLAQAQSALELPINYLALGPIFGTISKENPDPVVGLQQLGAIKSGVPGIPVVAIGGINRANRASVLAAGADAVAVISDLWPAR